MNMTFSYYLEPLFIGDCVHAPYTETIQMYIYINRPGSLTIQKINDPNSIKVSGIKRTLHITFDKDNFDHLYVIIKAYQ